MQLSLPTNSVRWDQSLARGHTESYFLKANDPQCPGRALWIKFTLLVPEDGTEGLGELWAIRFDGETGRHQGAKASFPLSSCSLQEVGLGLVIGPGRLEPGHTRGEAGDGDQNIRWDLRFDVDDQSTMFGLPHAWMYEASFPKNKVYSPCPRTRFRGSLSVAGDLWKIEDWVGMLGHNWGRSHNPRYHWAQCNMFGDDDCVFEGYSARIALGPWLSPWLTGAVVRYQGEDLKFNSVTGALNSSVEAELFRWSFRSRQGGWQMHWEVEAPVGDFAGLVYRNPDGTENQCLNSKIASCRLRLSRKTGRSWEPVADLKGKRTCAYEILQVDTEHGVVMLA
ncbi:MAG: hypothetical protein CL928_03730 [Deltaproteobacteria bacterium]|nr:hypothetical protein [Deltaproteobacteria bacterium]